MAKITLAPDIESISGRLCKKSAATYATNKHTGRVYRYDYHPGSQPNSEDQQAVKTLFTQKSKAASAWWATNKPQSKTDKGTADYQKLMQMYDAQHNIGNPYSYFRSLVTDDLKVTLGANTLQLSVSGGTTPSGGGGGGNIDM